jgi:glycogen synthase
VASAGRLSAEKGTTFLLHAVPELQRQFWNARFVIFGSGGLRGQLEQLANHLGVSAAVLFAGHVPDLPSLLPGIDVLVNPSLAEQMPNVVLEAMAASVPIVATAVGAVKEIAGEDNTLAMVPPADAAAIARTVRTLLLDSALAGAMGCAGQKRVEEAFSLARQSTQLRALYDEFVPNARLPKASPTPGMFKPVVMIPGEPPLRSSLGATTAEETVPSIPLRGHAPAPRRPMEGVSTTTEGVQDEEVFSDDQADHH